MPRRPLRRVRDRLFVGAEGRGEVSFAVWLGRLCDAAGLFWAFDNHDLGGGAPPTLLNEAVRRRSRGERNGAYAASILLLDADRIDDEAAIRRQAERDGFTLVVQRPKHEGVLLRLHDGQERRFPPPEEANRLLLRVWPDVWGGNHRRALDADTLARRFTRADLHRAAAHDDDLRLLLSVLGLPP